LVSTLAKTQVEAMQFAFMIMLPSVLLSGFAFPRAEMPSPIYEVTFLLPATYFIEILRGLFLKGSGVSVGGCADATIYRRCLTAGLTALECFPQLQTITPAEPRLATFEQQIESLLNDKDAALWWRGVAEAKADGTFFVATPLHCAVGTKP
jgi:hypothetical protein